MTDNIEYLKYINIRDHILKYKENQKSKEGVSDYWIEEANSFDYLLNATPEILAKFRHHCFHITGDFPYKYRGHHSANLQIDYEVHLATMKGFDKNKMFIPEPPELGGFGFNIDGLVNVDTLKFYEVMLNLQGTPLFHALEKGIKVIEIGPGWGGFGFQLKKRFPKTKILLIDLPDTLLFSTTYLKGIFNQDRHIYFGEPGFNKNLENEDYDFAYAPHFAFPEISLENFSATFNIASFQEMTSSSITEYCEILKESKVDYLYSFNRPVSPYNTQVQDVAQSIEFAYDLEQVNKLPYTYIEVNKKSGRSQKRDLTPAKSYQHLKKILISLIFKKKKAKSNSKLKRKVVKPNFNKRDLNYQHLFGILK